MLDDDLRAWYKNAKFIEASSRDEEVPLDEVLSTISKKVEARGGSPPALIGFHVRNDRRQPGAEEWVADGKTTLASCAISISTRVHQQVRQSEARTPD